MSFSDKIKGWIDRGREKHKLSFTNDTTYHEKWSFRLSRFNLWTLFGLYTIGLIVVLTLLIKTTPLQELFVESAEPLSVQQINENSDKIDSLESDIRSRQMYLDDLQKILTDTPFDDSLVEGNDSMYVNYQANFDKSPEDSLLRYKIENEGKAAAELSYDFFSSPVSGKVSKSFNLDKGHYGVDVVTIKDEPVKSCLEGTVVFAGWTPNEGQVVIIQHNNDFISVYKHCSSLLKDSGDQVQTSDPVGIVGNSGEHTSGPHLHFELWQKGNPINPQEFISFQK